MNKSGVFISNGILLLLLFGCLRVNNADLEQELFQAVERFLIVQTEAELTLNTDEFPNVATGDALKNMRSSLGVSIQNTNSVERISDTIEIEWFEVVDAGPTWATVDFKHTRRAFSQNIQTGERDYDNTTRWYIDKYLLIKEEGTWKVSRVLESLDWGFEVLK